MEESLQQSKQENKNEPTGVIDSPINDAVIDTSIIKKKSSTSKKSQEVKRKTDLERPPKDAPKRIKTGNKASSNSKNIDTVKHTGSIFPFRLQSCFFELDDEQIETSSAYVISDINFTHFWEEFNNNTCGSGTIGKIIRNGLYITQTGYQPPDDPSEPQSFEDPWNIPSAPLWNQFPTDPKTPTRSNSPMDYSGYNHDDPNETSAHEIVRNDVPEQQTTHMVDSSAVPSQCESSQRGTLASTLIKWRR